MLLPFKNALVTYWRLSILVGIVLAVILYLFIGRDGDFGATLVITEGDFSKTVNISGTVIPAKEVQLGFSTSGRIARTYAMVGDYVAQGSIIAEIENGDLSAVVAQKRAALQEAEAKLASLRAGTRSEQLATASATVASAQAAVGNALQGAFTTADDAIHNKADQMFDNPRTQPKLSFSTANVNLKNILEANRASLEPVLVEWKNTMANFSTAQAVDIVASVQANLVRVSAFLAELNAAVNQGVPDQGASAATLSSYTTAVTTARSNVNTVITTLTTAVSALTAAQSELSLLQAGSTADTIRAQEASVSSASAEVENALAALLKTRIVAPFGGTVTRMDVQVGEIVSPAASEIAMQTNGVFQIETFIPEVTIADVTSGNTAVATLDAYGSSVTFPAKVISVDPAETVKDGVPTYKTTLTFLESDPRIRSGMTVSVVITTGTLQNAIVIPSGAVGVHAGVRYVSLVKEAEAVSQVVEVGPSPSLGQAHILSGLRARDVILLTPLPFAEALQ